MSNNFFLSTHSICGVWLKSGEKLRTRVTDILCVLIKVLLLSEIAKWRVYFLLLIDNQMLLRRFVTFSRTLNLSEFLFSLIGGPRLHYFNVPPCLKLYVSAPLLPGPRQWRLLRDVHKAVCSGPDSWRFIRTSLRSPPHVSDCCFYHHHAISQVYQFGF